MKLTNANENLNVYLETPKFFNGEAIVEVDVDLRADPLRWVVRPELTEVDSKRFLEWRNQSVNWVALFAVMGTAEFSGNSEAELYRTLQADHEFDGGQGQLDITLLKQQLAQIALLTKRGESVNDWPNEWNYETLVGRWETRGQNQAISFTLDNLAIEADGIADYAEQTVDLLANVTISPPPPGSPLSVNPLLENTPIPLRCRGPYEDIKCKVDDDAAQRLVARALQRGDDSGLRQKLEEKIEEEVPEEYREAARGLLDLLGRALDK